MSSANRPDVSSHADTIRRALSNRPTPSPRDPTLMGYAPDLAALRSLDALLSENQREALEKLAVDSRFGTWQRVLAVEALAGDGVGIPSEPPKHDSSFAFECVIDESADLAEDGADRV